MTLKRLDIQVQAEKFIDYFGRAPAADLADVFEEWAKSKDFEPGDRHAIWIEIKKLLRDKSSNSN